MVSELNNQLSGLRDEFKKEFGTDDINIHTGEIENAMHFSVGQSVYGGHTISDIIEGEDKYSIYIKKNKDVLPWKDFNKNMAISVEYNLEY